MLTRQNIPWHVTSASLPITCINILVSLTPYLALARSRQFKSVHIPLRSCQTPVCMRAHTHTHICTQMNTHTHVHNTGHEISFPLGTIAPIPCTHDTKDWCPSPLSLAVILGSSIPAATIATLILVLVSVIAACKCCVKAQKRTGEERREQEYLIEERGEQKQEEEEEEDDHIYEEVSYLGDQGWG